MFHAKHVSVKVTSLGGNHNAHLCRLGMVAEPEPTEPGTSPTATQSNDRALLFTETLQSSGETILCDPWLHQKLHVHGGLRRSAGLARGTNGGPAVF